eukprot:6086148-Pyramimonas_sp.AAC.1
MYAGICVDTPTSRCNVSRPVPLSTLLLSGAAPDGQEQRGGARRGADHGDAQCRLGVAHVQSDVGREGLRERAERHEG